MSDEITLHELKSDILELTKNVTRLDQELYSFSASFSELKNNYVGIVDDQTSKLNAKLTAFDRDTKELREFSKYIMDFFNPNIKAQNEISRLKKELEEMTSNYTDLKNSLSGLVKKGVK